MIRIAILDDYQNVSLEMADWSPGAQRSRFSMIIRRTGIAVIAPRSHPFLAKWLWWAGRGEKKDRKAPSQRSQYGADERAQRHPPLPKSTIDTTRSPNSTSACRLHNRNIGFAIKLSCQICCACRLNNRHIRKK